MRTVRQRHGKAAEGISIVEVIAALSAGCVVAALSVSSYRTYMVRKQIAACTRVAANARDHVVQAFRSTGEPPADRNAANLVGDATADSGPFVAGIDVADGRVMILVSDDADAAIAGQTLSLTPYETADLKVVWICGNKVPGTGLKPLGFANGGRQSSQMLTTIDARYLPSDCR
jgi:hypothetical protein